MKRRKFFKYLAGGTLAAASLPGYSALIEPNKFEVSELSLVLKRISSGMDGLRAVQISDFHVGPWFTERQLEQVINKVLALKPELVFLTGDYLTINGDHANTMKSLYNPMRELAGRTAVYSVMGNHDLYEGFDPELAAMFASVGITDVTNRYVTYLRGGDSLHIAGVGTLATGHMDLLEVSNTVPRGAAVMLLAHEPDVAQWTKKLPHYILQLSGHSHGGQIILPHFGPVMLPWMGNLYPAGLVDLGSMYLYTNRGLGMTRLPFRLNCPPEITLFTFRQQTG